MDLPEPELSPTRRVFFRLAWPLIRWATGFMAVDHSYATGLTFGDGNLERGCLDGAGISWEVLNNGLSRIPKEGPVLVISNHAYGMADGLLQALLAGQVRADYKQMVNEMLTVFPKLTERYILVNAFDSEEARAQNTSPLREALGWLKDGHLLATFPAGAVSHRTWASTKVVDPPWNPSLLMLARRSKATIVPMYFHGHNGRLFQWAGLLSARLRTAMIPRGYVNTYGRCIRVSIGEPIDSARLKSIHDRDDAIEYLRMKVSMLNDDSHDNSAASDAAAPPAVTSPAADCFAREIDQLPPDNHFGDSGKLSVYIARPEHIPGILSEIGRLREVTFRAAGEGTGNALDLDSFDAHYRHLFIWNRADNEVVGAYRLGLTDEILEAKGIEGCYTRTLFQYEQEMLEQLGPSIELGRSFIRPEYQRGFKPLMLLWRGISNFAARHRKYRHAFGVVSISNDYRDASRHLITQFLMDTTRLPEYEALVQAKTPYEPRNELDITEMRSRCATIEDVDEVVKELEPNGMGVPVLVRQYLKLEAKLLAPFNIDHAFAEVIDGLMLVDFMQVERRIAHFYLGKELAAAFRTWHGFEPFDDEDEHPGPRPATER
jgi:putative hemolysin